MSYLTASSRPSSGEKDAAFHPRQCSGNILTNNWLVSLVLLLVYRKIIRCTKVHMWWCWSQSDLFQLCGTRSPVKTIIFTNTFEKKAGYKMKTVYMMFTVLWKAFTQYTQRETIIWQLSIVLAVSVQHNVVKIHSLFTNMQNSKFPCAKKEVEMTLLGSLTLFSLPYTCRGHSCIPSGKHSYLWVAGLYASFILL